MNQKNSPTSIPDEHLEFIERQLFNDFTEALRKHEDGHPNYDEVLAYENALDTITQIRNIVSDRNDMELIENTAEQTIDTLDMELPNN